MNFLRNLMGNNKAEPLPQDETDFILQINLDNDFVVYPLAETKTSLAQIKTIAKKYGVQYPIELAAHICGRFPGIYVEVKEEIWARPQKFEVAPFWSFLYGFHTFTSAPESEAWMQLAIAAETFQNQTGLQAAPILRVIGDADIYCVNSEGQIVRFFHETNELEPVNLTFWQLFEQEVTALYERKERKKSLAAKT